MLVSERVHHLADTRPCQGMLEEQEVQLFISISRSRRAPLGHMGRRQGGAHLGMEVEMEEVEVEAGRDHSLARVVWTP